MSHRRKQKKPFFSVSFRVILIIFASALSLSYLSIFINPAKVWLAGFFGLYFFLIASINFILLIVALVRKSSSAWIPFLILLPSLFFADHFICFNKPDLSISHQDNIKLITYNVGRFRSNKEKMSVEENKKKISEFILSENPDAVCFQEFSIKDTADIHSVYPQYPYRQYHFFKFHPDEFVGNITLSKFPIVSGGKISFKGSTNLSIFSDINYRERRIRIYNNHLESNNISLTSIIKKLSRNYEELSSELASMHIKVRGSTFRRAKQVDMVLNHIKESDYLSIVCGDFNDTPISFTFHKLSQGRKDTFKEAGRGFAATYSILWPLLRIDYILVPEAFNVLQHTTPRISFSDHYPVLTEIYCNYDITNQSSH